MSSFCQADIRNVAHGRAWNPYSDSCVHRHEPARTVYLAFGHDEEVGGGFGAAAMAEELSKQGIEFEHIFDEGGSILVDGIKGLLVKPLGLVGTAEKVRLRFSSVRAAINCSSYLLL